jgi:predicted nucleotidyltransferase
MDETIGQVLAELKSRLSALYGVRLKGVFLFGSYARNAADEESEFRLALCRREPAR